MDILIGFAALVAAVGLIIAGSVKLTIGTRTLLYGYHAFYLHWFFVARAWFKLYGSTWNIRHWVAFLVHDFGYWGCADLDGPAGKWHPTVGASIMNVLFDHSSRIRTYQCCTFYTPASTYWQDFTGCHSRHYAAAFRRPVSRLCAADKLALTLYPKWLLKILVEATGEVREYKELAYQHTGERYTTNEWIRFIRHYFGNAAHELSGGELA